MGKGKAKGNKVLPKLLTTATLATGFLAIATSPVMRDDPRVFRLSFWYLPVPTEISTASWMSQVCRQELVHVYSLS